MRRVLNVINGKQESRHTQTFNLSVNVPDELPGHTLPLNGVNPQRRENAHLHDTVKPVSLAKMSLALGPELRNTILLQEGFGQESQRGFGQDEH